MLDLCSAYILEGEEGVWWTQDTNLKRLSGSAAPSMETALSSADLTWRRVLHWEGGELQYNESNPEDP